MGTTKKPHIAVRLWWEEIKKSRASTLISLVQRHQYVNYVKLSILIYLAGNVSHTIMSRIFIERSYSFIFLNFNLFLPVSSTTKIRSSLPLSSIMCNVVSQSILPDVNCVLFAVQCAKSK